MRRTIARIVLALAVAGASAALGPAALAHEKRTVGDVSVVVGWLQEPAFAGFQNAVQLAAEDGSGEPVESGDLEVVVLFGGPDAGERTEAMPLSPAFGVPGEYHAPIIPTRPGTYTFRITGTLGGSGLDETFTSGPDTFNEVRETAGAEFPAQDPTRGELAEKVNRLEAALEQSNADVDVKVQDAVSAANADLDERVGALVDERLQGLPEAPAASEESSTGVVALVIAIAALIVAAAGVVLVMVRRPAEPKPTP